MKPIGKFHFDGKDFGFSWESAAESLSNSIYLINCALRIQASEYKHVLALRPPSISTPIIFKGNTSPKGDAKLENLPNMESVKIVLVDIPATFPKFDYPKNKNFLEDKSDSLTLAFKKDNIDIIRGVVASKLRGSKMAVTINLAYITPDKQFQPLASLKKFEIAAKQVTDEFDQLDARVKLLNAEYAKLNSKEDKAAFTRVTNKNKLSEQLTVTRRYKDHVQNTLTALKAIDGSELNFRIFYQAGEIEVDLATPDGKKYAPPRPAPANQEKGKAKAKK